MRIANGDKNLKKIIEELKGQVVALKSFVELEVAELKTKATENVHAKTIRFHDDVLRDIQIHIQRSNKHVSDILVKIQAI